MCQTLTRTDIFLEPVFISAIAEDSKFAEWHPKMRQVVLLLSGEADRICK